METLVLVLVLLLGLTQLMIRIEGRFPHGGETTDDRSKVLNQPAVMTFSMENGDIVDCVDIYKQPVFDNPSLGNHRIQMEPSSRPRDIIGKRSRKPFIHASLDSVDCPTGTVPIRSSSTSASQMPPKKGLLDGDLGDEVGKGQNWAIRGTLPGTIYGGYAEVSIHTIDNIQYHNQTSGALLVIYDGKDPPQNDMIIVGWLIDYDLYQDYRPRLTVYAHVNGKGCFNVLCPGFVHTSKKVYLGASFSNVSTIDGDQYAISLLIHKDERTQAWWFACGEDLEPVGYWPASMFTTLAHSAFQMRIGGYVYDPPGNQFLSPKMGSGRCAQEGFKKAAFVSDVRIVDGNNTRTKPTNFYLSFLDDDRFYSLGKLKDGGDLALHFFYGGPGGSFTV